MANRQCMRKAVEEFARANDLQLETTHEATGDWARTLGMKPWIARFADAEVVKGGIAMAEYGAGDTPEDAVAAYAKAIQGCVVCVNGHAGARREIRAPHKWV